MEAKNFRIGNYLLTDYSYLCKVELIHKKHFDCREITTGNFIPNGKYKEILLDEEWIEALGLIYDSTFLCWELNNFKLETDFNDVFWIEYNGVRKDVIYVHQLQNLFFALTENELQTKNEASACS